MQCCISAGRRYSHRANTPTEKDPDLKFKNIQIQISFKQHRLIQILNLSNYNVWRCKKYIKFAKIFESHGNEISVLYLVCLWHSHIAIVFDSHNIISSKFHCKIETLGFGGGGLKTHS